MKVILATGKFMVYTLAVNEFFVKMRCLMVEGKRLRKMLAALVIGTLAATVAANADARRVHDPKVLAKATSAPTLWKGRTL